MDPRCARCATRDAWQAVPEYAEKPRSLRRLIVHESRGQLHRHWLRRYYRATRRPSPRPSEVSLPRRGDDRRTRGKSRVASPVCSLSARVGGSRDWNKAVVRTSAACGNVRGCGACGLWGSGLRCTVLYFASRVKPPDGERHHLGLSRDCSLFPSLGERCLGRTFERVEPDTLRRSPRRRRHSG